VDSGLSYQISAVSKYVIVFGYPDGRLSIRYREVNSPTAPSTRFAQVEQGVIAANKHGPGVGGDPR
jgi:hypothetical protein